MRIPRIYQTIPLASEREISLDAIASQHLLKVLRLREGASVIVFNGNGDSYRGVLTQVSGKTAVVNLHERINEVTESPLQIHVGLGISKGERMDYAIQKLVETGVHSITPLVTEYTVVKLDAKREQTRLQHWQGVIGSACEQCGRSFLPSLHAVGELSAWLGSVTTECKLVFDATGTTPLKSIQPTPVSVSVLIGPEGGLSEHEVSAACRHGFQSVRLGPRILRTETAAVAISAALQTLWGDY
jgi:16S rRNA (uracil1498-N3)-methyltransferase